MGNAGNHSPETGGRHCIDGDKIMKRIAILLGIFVVSISSALGQKPRLTVEQVSQILTLVVEHEGVEPREFSRPGFDKSTSTWHSMASNGFVHGDTFLEVSDWSGRYRTFTYSSPELPRFRLSPRLRREIRKIISGEGER